MTIQTIAAPDASAQSASVLGARTAVSIAQAIALAVLAQAASSKSWLAMQPWLFEPLLGLSLFIPALVIVGVGQIRNKPLAIWIGAAALATTLLAHHDAVRGAAPGVWSDNHDAFLQSFALVLAWAGALALGHILLADSARTRRPAGEFGTDCHAAWKLGIEGVFAAGLIGLLWGALFLGAGLFHLVAMDQPLNLILSPGFAIVVTVLTAALGVHIIDRRPALVRGARSIIAMLLSWLFPVLVAILLAFLVSLPFVSLAPLWNTHVATGLLLAASGVLIFLIAANNLPDASVQAESRSTRLATAAASIELPFLIGLATWALALRVVQYGWSVERIRAAAIVVLGAGYAIGCLYALASSDARQERIAGANRAASCLCIVVVLALFTSIADPARLMVADQVARLKSGAVRPEEFDFDALRTQGAHWGVEALSSLSQDSSNARAVQIAELAKPFANTAPDAEVHPAPSPGSVDHFDSMTSADLARFVDVYPAGAALPAEIDGKALHRLMGVPSCVYKNAGKCTARFIRLYPNAADAILFADHDLMIVAVLERNAAGIWELSGTLKTPVSCQRVITGLKGENVDVQPHPVPDVIIDGMRFEIDSSKRQEC